MVHVSKWSEFKHQSTPGLHFRWEKFTCEVLKLNFINTFPQEWDVVHFQVFFKTSSLG